MAKAIKFLTLATIPIIFTALNGCSSSGDLCLFGKYETTEIQWVKKKFSLESKSAAVSKCVDKPIADRCKEYLNQSGALEYCRLSLSPEISQCMHDKGFVQEEVKVTGCKPMLLF